MVNWISVRSILDIASIYEFPIRLIDIVIEFSQSDLDANVFMDLPLGTGFDGNRGV